MLRIFVLVELVQQMVDDGAELTAAMLRRALRRSDLRQTYFLTELTAVMLRRALLRSDLRQTHFLTRSDVLSNPLRLTFQPVRTRRLRLLVPLGELYAERPDRLFATLHLTWTSILLSATGRSDGPVAARPFHFGGLCAEMDKGARRRDAERRAAERRQTTHRQRRLECVVVVVVVVVVACGDRISQVPSAQARPM